MVSLTFVHQTAFDRTPFAGAVFDGMVFGGTAPQETDSSSGSDKAILPGAITIHLLTTELDRLRHGGGLQAPHPQIGRMLSRLAGFPDDTGWLTRQELARLLDSVLDHLPHELATTFATLVNLRPQQAHQTLPRRMALLAIQAGVEQRTIRRRWGEAARRVAELLLLNDAHRRRAEAAGDTARPSDDRATASAPADPTVR